MTWFGKLVEDLRKDGKMIENQHDYPEALKYAIENPEEFDRAYKDNGTVNTAEAEALGDYHHYWTHINKVSGMEFSCYVRLISKDRAVILSRCPEYDNWEAYTLVRLPAELQAKMGLAA